LEGSVIIQSALPELPQLYVPDVDSLDLLCTRLQDVSKPIRLLEVVGQPGRGRSLSLLSPSSMICSKITAWLNELGLRTGKLTTAIAVVRHAVMTLHWATGYCAPFQVPLQFNIAF